MNDFEKFLKGKPFGFITDKDLPELVRLHRLCSCLVRTGAGRFICGAQYVEHYLKCIAAGGDYVRDVSITSDEIKTASLWRPEPPCPPPFHPPAVVMPKPAPARARRGPVFDEADCGGVFDGSGVISDADPGL